MQGQAYALVRDQQTAMNMAANFGSGVNGADSSVLLDPQAGGMGVYIHLASPCGLLLCMFHTDRSALWLVALHFPFRSLRTGGTHDVSASSLRRSTLSIPPPFAVPVP